MPPSTIQIPFTGGIDQKTEAEYLDPNTRLFNVINGYWPKEGGIHRRFGLTSLGNGQIPNDPTMQPPLRLLTRGAELLRSDGDSLFALSPTSGLWSQKSLLPAPYATRSSLFTNTAGGATFNVAEGSGYRAMVYRNTLGASTAGDVFLTLQDLASGEYVYLNFLLTTGATFACPICHIIGNNVYVLYCEETGAHIFGQVVNLTTMAITGQTAIVSDKTQSGFTNFDSASYVGGTGILIIYAIRNGAHDDVKYLRLEALPALTISSSALLTANGDGTNVICVACAHNKTEFNRAWFVWEQIIATYSVQSTAFDATTWTSVGATAFSCTFTGDSNASTKQALGLEILSASRALIAFVGSTTTSATSVYDNAAGAQISTFAYPLGQLVGRPFRATINGTTRCYMPFASNETIIPNGAAFVSLLLMDTRAYETGQLPRVVATIAPRQLNATYLSNLGMYLDSLMPHGSHISLPTAGTYSLAFVMNGPEEFSGLYTAGVTKNPVFTALATYDFTGSLTWQYAEGDAQTYVASGAPSFYDGAGLQECSFFTWPTPTGNPTINNAGGFLSTGQYGYAFAYAEVDTLGLVHRSAVYTQTVTTTTNTSQVTWTFNNIPYTNRYAARRNPIIEIYRTAVNLTQYYYVGAVACNPANNNGTLTYNDVVADTTITSNTLLYTTGGVLDSVCPPSARAIWRHASRIWMIDDSGYAIWFSTQFNGSDAPYFNEGLTLQWPDGPLTAGIEMDDKNLIFSAQKIWLLSGDGPGLTGQGNDLQTAVPIPSDVGATDWRSIVVYPQGLLFQAPNSGIYKLGRDLQVTYIGKSVQDMTAGLKVVGAHLIDSQNCVRFLMSDGSSIRYDYVFDRWSKDTYTYALTNAAMANGAWVAGSSDGNVYQENTTASVKPWFDTKAGVSTFVSTTIVMANLHPQGIQAWMQLGHVEGYAAWLDPVDITMQLSFDYGRAIQSKTFAHSALNAWNVIAAQFDMMAQAANSTASAVAVSLFDAAAADGTTSTGQGVRWLGVAIDVEPIAGRNLNLPASVKA